jgi:hypothetical protein
MSNRIRSNHDEDRDAFVNMLSECITKDQVDHIIMENEKFKLLMENDEDTQQAYQNKYGNIGTANDEIDDFFFID